MRTHHIRLELAREPGRPEGDGLDGYDLIIPLTSAHRLDAPAAAAAPEQTRVRRFIDGDTVAVGQLSSDGDGGWTFDFPSRAEAATGFRLEEELFVLGEYVSVADTSGVAHPYRVTWSRPLDGT